MRKPVINSHCHFINFKYIPDSMTNLLIKDKLKLFGISKAILSKLSDNHMKGFDLFNIRQKLTNFLSQNVNVESFISNFTREISEIADYYIGTMNEELTCVDISTPLMMDLAPGIGVNNDEFDSAKYGMLKYSGYIQEISDTVLKYPFRIMPFIMFDPRREGSADICIKALNDYGFVGIKMYTAMGYSPYWEHNIGNEIDQKTNLKQILKKTLRNTNRETVKENLIRMYEHCSKNQIPITVHAGIGGSFDLTISSDEAKELIDPANWEKVLISYDLKLNFAHFGGDYLGSVLSGKDVEKTSQKFAKKILEYIKNYDKKYKGTIFTDLSCHGRAFDMTEDYFNDLKYHLKLPDYKESFLYGTDYPFSLLHFLVGVIRDLKNYTITFRQNLNSSDSEKIMQDNAIAFLFKNNKIPDSYIKFIKSKINNDKLFNWLYYAGNDNYFVYTTKEEMEKNTGIYAQQSSNS